MTKGLNLKTTFSADTSDIKKGAKESAAAVGEFKDKAGSSIDAFAGLFGTSMGQISGAVRTFQGGLTLMHQGFQGSATSTSLLSKALGILKIALISTGIGAIVVALGSLVAYFKRSQDGADALARIMAPLKVLFNALGDIAASLGRAIFNAFKDPQKAIKDCWEAIKKNIVNRFVGLVDSFKGLGSVIKAAFSFDWEGVKAGAKEVGTAMLQFTTGLDKQQRESIAKWVGARATETAKWMRDSQILADREAALEKNKIAFIREEARMVNAIADNREKASDTESYDYEKRLAFSKKAEDLTRALYGKRVELAKEEFDIKKKQADLDNAVDLNSETKEVAELGAAIDNLYAAMNTELKGLNKEQKKLTAGAKEEREAREKIAAMRANILPKVDSSAVDKITDKVKALKNETNDKRTFAFLQWDVQSSDQYISAMKSFKTQVVDISQEIKQAFAEIAVAVGESLGELIAGEGGWDNFGRKVASVVADLAITIGKIAITAGIATLGIKAALESMNGYLAIAAGVALVALGTAVKSSLNAAASGASGTYSSNSYKVSSAGSGMSSSSGSSESYESRVIAVQVSGTLQASGNVLTAVIENENRRKKLTT